MFTPAHMRLTTSSHLGSALEHQWGWRACYQNRQRDDDFPRGPEQENNSQRGRGDRNEHRRKRPQHQPGTLLEINHHLTRGYFQPLGEHEKRHGEWCNDLEGGDYDLFHWISFFSTDIRFSKPLGITEAIFVIVNITG